MDEKKLILDLQNNSAEAFNQLYKAYAPRLYGFIYNLTKSTYLAKEIVQETFLKIWERRAEVRSDLSFKSYLFMIAKNQIINSFRNQLTMDDLTEASELHNSIELSENSTEQEAELNELKEYLESAKDKLTPRQKEIFELSREKGLSNQEIADLLQISNQTVKNQLHLSLQTLKDQINKRMWVMLPLIYFFINE